MPNFEVLEGLEYKKSYIKIRTVIKDGNPGELGKTEGDTQGRFLTKFGSGKRCNPMT